MTKENYFAEELPKPDVKHTDIQPDVKIFVSNRIDLNSQHINNKYYIPVRCGAVYDERSNVTVIGDDSGDNISEKRMSFCELTVQYWAWKNIEADYYGLCHYRRYLSFSETTYPEADEESNNGCVVADYISEANVKKFSLLEDAISKAVQKYDVIANKPIKAKKTNYQAMLDSPDYHDIKDVDKAIAIVKRLYPYMSSIVDEYMGSKEVRLYNCFVMKKEIFNEYCQWLFNILFELEKELDMSHYSQQKYRTPGTIGERLYGIYCLYLKRVKKVRFKEAQLVFFSHAERNEELIPRCNDQITLAFNFNNEYSRVFSVCLSSIIAHLSKDKQYELIVFSEDISSDNKRVLLAQIDGLSNISIRFCNPFNLFSGVKLFVDNPVYSKDLYVRTIIPYVLQHYSKVLVLDVDISCEYDIAELFYTNLNGRTIGAVKDIVFSGYLNGTVPGSFKYAKNELKLSDPYNYCNTGVLLIDCERYRAKYTLDFILNHIEKHHYRIYEQDMINVLFDGDIQFLDRAWNLYSYTNEHVKKSVFFSPMSDYHEYLCARKQPKLIHFAAHPKPWWCAHSDFSETFWKYARLSPYYEELLAQVGWFVSNNIVAEKLSNGLGVNNAYANGNETIARKVANGLVPVGSIRRKIAKAVFPKGSHRRDILKKMFYVFYKYK